DIGDDSGRPGRDALADAASGREHRSAALQLEAHETRRRAVLDRLGARLKDIEPPVDAVLAPLDVHRAAVVTLDDDRLARELDDLIVGQREPPPLCRVDV